jgi:hypothetical protein
MEEKKYCPLSFANPETVDYCDERCKWYINGNCALTSKKILIKAKEIKTLEWFPHIDNKLNMLLNDGWILIHIGESYREEGGDVIYTLIRVK